MLNANTTCQLIPVMGFDVYGKPQLGTAVTEKCAIVKLRLEQQHTTVRADSSQSRGHGDEFTSTNNILLDSTTGARDGDKLIVHGHEIKIVSMHDRFDVLGFLDHYECVGEQWAS